MGGVAYSLVAGLIRSTIDHASLPRWILSRRGRGGGGAYPHIFEDLPDFLLFQKGVRSRKKEPSLYLSNLEREIVMNRELVRIPSPSVLSSAL